MKKLILLPLLCLCGCVATSSHVITGKIHPPLSPEAVKFLTEQPDAAEIIGIVNASNIWKCKQPGMDSVMKQICKEAGSIGANGIIITGQHNSQMDGAAICGTALFVP